METVSKADQLRALRERQHEEYERRLADNSVTNTPSESVTNQGDDVTNAPRKSAVNGSARVRRWRAANPERYRAYMRDLMRRRRAAKKEPAT